MPSAAQNPIASTATTNANGYFRGPIPIRPRVAPRIMIAPNATGIPRARSHGAHGGAPPGKNAAAYPRRDCQDPGDERHKGSRLVVSVAVVVHLADKTQSWLNECEQCECRQPMLAHVITGNMRQARSEMVSAASSAIDRRGSLAGHVEAIERQHHARLRFSPSRCAIFPSLRSLTAAGLNSVAGCRFASVAAEIDRASARIRVASTTLRMHSASIERRRKEVVSARLPRLAIRIAAYQSRAFRTSTFRSVSLLHDLRVLERQSNGERSC